MSRSVIAELWANQGVASAAGERELTWLKFDRHLPHRRDEIISFVCFSFTRVLFFLSPCFGRYTDR